jgi:T-complex protein 1 subunit alpha
MPAAKPLHQVPLQTPAQVVEEAVAGDDMVMIRGAANARACSVLLRGANDYMLDEMDRSLHDAFCVVKRVLESGRVVPGGRSSLLPLTPEGVSP